MFGKAFKPRKYYVFDYKPRYYSERKERISNLENEHHKNDEGARIKLTKNNLKTDWVRNTKMATDRGTTRRLAIIIAILVGIVAYLFELHKLF